MFEAKMPSVWWMVPVTTLIGQCDVDPELGMSAQHIETQRSRFGANRLTKIVPMPLYKFVLEGLTEPMMLMLLGIAALALMFGRFLEASTMFFEVLAYISFETYNKFRADRTMSHLKSLVHPTAQVLRDGIAVEVATEDVVVGDILILSEGSEIPGDARLLSSYGLMLNEAALTGESVPIEKNAQAQIGADAPLAQRTNCVWSGTVVLSGQGHALVCAVGSQSEVGRIMRELQTAVQAPTVLQETMARLTKVLTIVAICASFIIPAVGYLRGFSFNEMVLTWLTMTFLMIPCQPPIIITMALALAAFELAKKKILVKKLRGVEGIGQVTCIVSDKTGTITENVMHMEKFFSCDTYQEVSEIPSHLQASVVRAIPQFSKDPTDQAVIREIVYENDMPQVGFTGFDVHSWRDIVYRKQGSFLHAIAGRPEILVAHAKISDEKRKVFEAYIQKEAEQGKRIAAYGWIESSQDTLQSLDGIELLGCAVIEDTVRPEVAKTLAQLGHAGITTTLVTGDYAATAQAIGKKVGITGPIVTGEQIEKMTDDQLVHLIHQHSASIFARMDPPQKMRVVNALQQSGEIVAVVGDGVNDAPALRAAHVSIAMGKIGTDLAKDISDLVLLDDNYIHIKEAVFYGRVALHNFRKGLAFYLSAKVVLLMLFVVPLVFGFPFPFVPIHIILIELIIDAASSTIFVAEPPESSIMEQPALSIRRFLSRSLLPDIARESFGLFLGILIAYLAAYYSYGVITAQTTALVSWLIGHILLALTVKQEAQTLSQEGIFANRVGAFWLITVTLLSFVITMVPTVAQYLETTQLPWQLWVLVMISSALTVVWTNFVRKKA